MVSMELKEWKLIKIRAETYDRLKRMKSDKDTFDSVIRRLINAHK